MGMLQAGNNYQVMPYRDEHLAMDFTQQAVILDSERMTLTRKNTIYWRYWCSTRAKSSRAKRF